MSIRDIIVGIQSANPAVRRSTIDELARIGGGEAAGVLVLLLADPYPEIQQRAADALAQIGPEAVAPLSRYLENWQGPLGRVVPGLVGRLRSESFLGLLSRNADDPDPETRAAIAVALGRIGGRQGVPVLLDLLRDMVDSVRIAAAHALGEIRDPETADALLDELADENPAVRAAAADALGLVGEHDSVDALAALSADDPDEAVRRSARAALRRASIQVIDPLIHALEGDDLSARIQAMSEILDQGTAATLPVAELLRDANPSVRTTAAEILGALGGVAAVEPLAQALGDAEATVRAAVTEALGKIKDKGSAHALARALQDQDGKVAGAAAGGLEALGTLSVEPLFRVLSSESADIRVRATDVLGRLRHKGACERLIRGLSENTGWVRIVSAQALGEICENRAVPALITVLEDRDAVVRAMAAEALGKLRDFRATVPLISRLQDSSDLVRINALFALGRIGNPAAAPFLIHHLTDPAPDVRVAAIEGLAELRATRALPELRQIARIWPLSREPGTVKRAARDAIRVLEETLEEEEAYEEEENYGV